MVMAQDADRVVQTVSASRNLNKAERIAYIDRRLQALYPNPPVPLDHHDPFTLLIAVLLSAQCPDERVNLTRHFPASTPRGVLASMIRAIIRAVCPQNLNNPQILLNTHDGEVPEGELEGATGGHEPPVLAAQAFWLFLLTRISIALLNAGVSPGRNVVELGRSQRAFDKKDGTTTPANYFLWQGTVRRGAAMDDGTSQLLTHETPQKVKSLTMSANPL